MRMFATWTALLLLALVPLGCSQPKPDPAKAGAGGGGAEGAGGAAATTAGAATGSPVTGATGGAGIGGSTEDMSFITRDHVAAVVVRPQRILKNPLLSSLPAEILAPIVEDTGVEPSDVVKITVLMRSALIPDPSAQGGPPVSPAAVIEFAKPVNATDLATRNWESFDTRQHNSRSYLVPGFLKDFPPDAEIRVATICQLGPTTVFAGEEPELKAILDNKGPINTPFAQMFQQLSGDDDIVAIGDMISIQERLKALAAAGGPEAAQMQPVITTLTSLQSAELRVNLSGPALINVALNVADAGAAANVKATVDGQIESAKGLYAFMKPQFSQQIPEGLRPKVVGMADQLVQGIAVKQDANKISISLAKPAGMDDMVREVMPAVVNAMQAGRAAAQNAMQRNKMKQVALAVHLYHDRYNEFPTGVRDADGKLLLSWRVQVLPFLEENDLYEQFKLDEPWDSEHNKELAGLIPYVFDDDERLENEEGMTRILAFQGEKALLDGKKKTFAEVPDGTSNTLMFVQAGPEKAVPWTQPVDLTLNPEDPWSSFGEVADSGLMAAFVDGAVRELAKTLDAEVLRNLVDPNDGKTIDLDF